MTIGKCTIKNSISTHVTATIFRWFAMVFTVSCAFVFLGCEYNFFGYTVPEPKDLLSDGTIEEFIDYLYLTDFQKKLENDEKREEIIAKLNEKISNKSGQARIKHRMALALVYARTSEFKQIYTTITSVRVKNFVDDNDPLLPNPRALIGKFFYDAEGKDITAILTNSERLRSTLILLGLDLQTSGDDNFPRSVYAIRGDFASQVLITGVIEMLIRNVVIPDPGAESRQYRLDLVSDFIGKPGSDVVFEYILHYSDCTLGPEDNPSGIEYVLEAGGYPSYIELLRKRAADNTQ